MLRRGNAPIAALKTPLKNSPLIPPARIARVRITMLDRAARAIAFSRYVGRVFRTNSEQVHREGPAEGGEHGVIAREYQNAPRSLVSVSRSYCPEKSRYAGRFIRFPDSVVGLRHRDRERKRRGARKGRERGRRCTLASSHRVPIPDVTRGCFLFTAARAPP